jgi:hypothetical protein
MSYLGYNVVQNTAPSNLNILGSLQAGQNFSQGLLQNYMLKQKANDQNKVSALQDQYANAQDEATKRGLLQQIAIYNPEHAKGILAVSQAGMNPFEGNSIEAQKANIQYQRYRAAGLTEGDARLRAINDAASTSAQYYTDAGGNRVTIGGLPLPDINTSQETLKPSASIITPSGSLSKSEQVVNNVPAAEMNIADHAGQATTEEIKFAQDFVAQPREAQADWYTKNAPAHPDLPKELSPEVKSKLYEAADHFNQQTNKTPPNPYANSPKVQVSAAEAQAKKNVEMGGLQPSTATDLEKKTIIYKRYKIASFRHP